MAITKCGKGHIYDSDQGGCPICAKEGNMWGGAPEEISATMPDFGGGYMPDYGAKNADFYGATEMDDVGATQPVTEPGFSNQDFMYQQSGNGLDSYDPTEVVPINKVSGFDPVVGWLISIKGPSRGRDYRIHSGKNLIGRSKEMDICIEHDATVSSIDAASLAYDDRSRTFFIQQGAKARNLIYLNGEPVLSPRKIVMYDRIEIGSTELMFIPLCGDTFNWQDI